MRANLIAAAKALFIIAFGFLSAGVVKSIKHASNADDMYYIAIADTLLAVILSVATGAWKGRGKQTTI